MRNSATIDTWSIIVFAIIYINDMPDILERTTPCLYADDTQISSSSHDYDTLIDNLNMDLSNIHKWLAKNKLKYHRKKTKVMFIGSTHNLNNKIGNRPVENNKIPVPQTNTFQCLGVNLDEKLSWEKPLGETLILYAIRLALE